MKLKRGTSKLLDYEVRIRDLSDSMKQNNIGIIGVPEEEREKGAEGIFEWIIADNFPNLGEVADIQVQEAQKSPFKINKNRSTPWHIIVKLVKYKEKESILKAATDKQPLTYKCRHIRVVADLSTETWQARREWQEIFNVLHCSKNAASSKLSFRIEGEIKAFPEKQTKGVYDH